MKKSRLCWLAVFAFIAFVGTSAQAQVITGQTMLNPYFTPDYSNWTFGGDFRADGTAERMVFDVKASGGNATGYNVAAGTGKTGAAIAAENSLSASSSYLTGFDLSQSQPYYLQLGPYGGSVTGTYQLYFQITMVTGAGSFQATSNMFNPIDFTAYPDNVGVALTPSFTWSSSGYLGDPSAYNGGLGVILADISSIQYDAVIFTDTANTAAGVSFDTIDNMSLIYQVSSVPEPSEICLLAAGLIFLVTRLKLRRQS